MFKRNIEQTIKNSVESFPITVLTGPRQSGKTTILKHIFPDFEYVYLEAPDKLLEIKNDPRTFLKKKVKGWIFDEAQRYPELFSYIQEYKETNKDTSVIITGSQSFLLNENISQSLAGRAAILELLPLSIDELLSIDKYKDNDLFQLMYSGF